MQEQLKPKPQRAPRGAPRMFFHTGTQRWAYAESLGKDENGKRLRVFLYAKTRSELQSKIMDKRRRGGGTIAPRIAGTVDD